jgi:hypothetical protein
MPKTSPQNGEVRHSPAVLTMFKLARHSCHFLGKRAFIIGNAIIFQSFLFFSSLARNSPSHARASPRLPVRAFYVAQEANELFGCGLVTPYIALKKAHKHTSGPVHLLRLKNQEEGCPRVRIAFFIIRKRLTAHRSAGEEARALFLFLRR